MCTYSISVDDTLMERVRPAFSDNEAIEAWMQTQMDLLLVRLAETLSPKPKEKSTLSSRLRGIASAHAHNLDTIMSMPLQEKSDVPDVVLSLLGAGEPVADHDLNAREAYHQYQMEKYQ